jgi:hypothetical protein
MFGGFSTRNPFGATGSAFPTRALAQLGGFDPATDFIAAANITNATQQAAIRTLVNNLVANSLWDKILAAYPMVGGNAYSHKFNLKNPKDANNAFRVQFFGGWTHGPSGAIGNGSNSWGATFFTPSEQYAGPSGAHICIYTDGSTAAFAAYDVGYQQPNFVIIGRWTDNLSYVALAQNAFSTVANSATATGLWFGNKSGLVTSLWHACPGLTMTRVINTTVTNAPFVATSSQVGVPIGAQVSSNSPSNFSNKQFKWVSFGYNMSDAEITTYETIVNQFQTALTRNLY